MREIDGGRVGSTTDNMSDNEVIETIRAGDRKAFSVLVRRHQKSLFRLSDDE